MDIIEQFIAAAQRRGGSVVLPEGKDPRIVAAARRLKDEAIAEPIVLGTPDQLTTAAADAGTSLDGIRTFDPRASERLDDYAAQYAQRRGLAVRAARRMLARPVFYGGMMVACGDADAMVSGIASATATVIQAGVLTIGLAPGISTPSSFFLMIVPQLEGRQDCPLIFADCAVNIDPTPTQLADIALASQTSAARLLAAPPRVAMLSFSTCGSAVHPHVAKVTEALAIARERAPEITIDGEFQADTALIERVAAKKMKRESDVAGHANVLIFPDLDAGNCAYKLTQYLAHAKAIGPFLQGFARPVSDLSRGASTDDVVATSAITLLQAPNEPAEK